MTISLDGFINDGNGSVGSLYTDLQELPKNDSFQKTQETTGAVIMGRKTFEMAKDPDTFADTYEFQVPLFIITRHPLKKKPKENANLSFHFITGGLKRAIKSARQAAGDKDIQVVGGAKTVQAILNQGLADELHLDIMPVFLGKGVRLFKKMETDTIRLTKINTENINELRTSLKFKVTSVKKKRRVLREAKTPAK